MQDPNSTSDPAVAAHPRSLIAVVLLVLLLALFLPPYINVGRHQRRIAGNIGSALGRPVHFDTITLNLLPVPSFTLENFVVDEDPAFGSEPILRANEVRANIRLRSLWSRRVEFSRIVLTDPSVNLVHTANGRWNVESLLLQASRSNAAPTEQLHSGPTPRIPYIEATGARLNLKLDQVKTPLSLTDADFALWLPEPHQWRLRVEAHPARTDSSPADTGIMRIEATLGNANTPVASLSQIPIDIHGSWKEVQLGGLSRLLVARDAGLRGELTLTFHLLGTLGQNVIATQISLDNARRAEFVPPHLLSIEADCRADSANTFHTFSNVACSWPPSTSSDAKLLVLTATLPNLRQSNSASATLIVPSLPVETFLDWIAVATPHPPTALTGPGTLAAKLTWSASAENVGAPSIPRSLRNGWDQTSQSNPILTGEIELTHESLNLPALGPKPIPLADIILRSSTPSTDRSPRRHNAPPVTPATTRFDLAPVSIPLGGKQPATLEGHFDATGYTLRLTGSALPTRLLALGDAIPQLGDGLRPLLEPSAPTPPSSTGSATHETEPIHLDLTATRSWGGPQTWYRTTPTPPHLHQ
jgi:AsmA protein